MSGIPRYSFPTYIILYSKTKKAVTCETAGATSFVHRRPCGRIAHVNADFKNATVSCCIKCNFNRILLKLYFLHLHFSLQSVLRFKFLGSFAALDVFRAMIYEYNSK